MVCNAVVSTRQNYTDRVVTGQTNSPLDNRQPSTVSGRSQVLLSHQMFILFVFRWNKSVLNWFSSTELWTHRPQTCSPGRGNEGRPHRGDCIWATPWRMRKRISGQRAAQIPDTGSWKGPRGPPGQSQPPWLRISGSEPTSYPGCFPSSGCLLPLSAWASTTTVLLSPAGMRGLTSVPWNQSVD